MASKQSPDQKDTVERVMHEFKHGELKANGGRRVRNPKQAIAIALHEAGASNGEPPAKNRENLRKTKAKEARGETGRDEAEGGGRKGRGSGAPAEPARPVPALYAEAKKKDVPGRSGMSKAELQKALGR